MSITESRSSKNIFELTLDGRSLNLDDVVKVARGNPNTVKLKICPQAVERVNIARQYVMNIVEKGEPVYGINTGFGALSERQIDQADLGRLQLNLIRSHCTGVGDPFPREVTRAIMLLRANCILHGHSGAQLEAVERLIDFIEHDVTPVVPQKGSVGASGDLAPLSHIALALIGEGDVFFEGKVVKSDFALHQIGKPKIILGPKDGLALINGTQAMLALGCLAIKDAEEIAKVADISNCLTLEGVRGTRRAYSALITEVKPHKGQKEVTQNLNALLADSEIGNSHHDCGKVQDPYSLRCTPQVHGSCRQAISHARDVITTELNAVTDNPLIFPESDVVVSGGNFHGEALALALDYLAMGIAEFCNIAERRIEKMMNPNFSDQPSFLIKGSGLNSGLMIAHVTAAALTSENKVLCHPASVDSVPTSTDKEDHVSMGLTSGRKVNEVAENTKTVLAIEMLANSQAIDFLRPLKSSAPLEAVHTLIRKHVDFIEEDRVFYRDIENIKRLISSGEIVKVAEEAIGELQ